MMRNLKLVEQELYHVYNRGVDKRPIFHSKEDIERFYENLKKLNTHDLVGHTDRRNPVSTEEQPLVEIVAYALNPNHFHFILKPLAEKGLERYMHRLCVSHSKYFNLKYRRIGALFQGRFGARHIDTNEYLLRASAYVNLNNHPGETLSRSSWSEYVHAEHADPLCKTDIVLSQFPSREEYRRFAEEAWEHTLERKLLLNELEYES